MTDTRVLTPEDIAAQGGGASTPAAADPLLTDDTAIRSVIGDGVSMLDALAAQIEADERDGDDVTWFRMPIEYQSPSLPQNALVAHYRILGRAERKKLETESKAINGGRAPKTAEQLTRMYAALLAEACAGIYMLDGDVYRPLDPVNPVRFDDRLAAALKLEGKLQSGADIVIAANSELVDTPTGVKRQPVDQAVFNQGVEYAGFCAKPTGDRDPFEVGYPVAS